MTRAEAGAALRELTRTHMVAEYLPARFTFHDLLRAYAADQAERHDSAPERRAAVHRVLDHYLHTAMAASQRFSPFRSALRLTSPQPGVLPADVTDKDQAMAWFDAEVPVLLALIGYAERRWIRRPRLADLPGPSARSSTGAAGGAPTRQPAKPRWRRRGGWMTPWPSRTRTTCWVTHSADGRLRCRRAERPAGARHVPGTWRPGQRGRGAQWPGGHAGKAGALPGGAGRRAGRAADAQGRRALVDAGHPGERGRLALRPPRPVRPGADPLPAGPEPAPGLRSPRRHRRHLDSLGYIYLHLGDFAQAKAHYAKAIEAYREIARPSAWGTRWPGSAMLLSPRAAPSAPARPARPWPPVRPGARPWRSSTACRTRSRTRCGARLDPPRDLDRLTGAATTAR
jgi:hypothetical protein